MSPEYHVVNVLTLKISGIKVLCPSCGNHLHSIDHMMHWPAEPGKGWGVGVVHYPVCSTDCERREADAATCTGTNCCGVGSVTLRNTDHTPFRMPRELASILVNESP